MISSNNQVALVTGASRRIGASIVKTLHALEYKVIIHCNQSLVEAKALAGSLNQIREDSALVLQADLKTVDPIVLIDKAFNWSSQLDVLINNASIFYRDDSSHFSWENLFKINVELPQRLSEAARPYLAKKEGVIINITDIHADNPLKEYSVYCQTKAALTLQTKALAKEFAPYVRVNAVAPGSIAWPEHDNQLSEALKEKIIEETPLKRHGSPEFISQAVIALIQNSFITGQILKVDGGRSLRF